MNIREWSDAEIRNAVAFIGRVLDTADKLRSFALSTDGLMSVSPMALRCLLAIAEAQGASPGCALPESVMDELREALSLTSTQPIGRPRVVVVVQDWRA